MDLAHEQLRVTNAPYSMEFAGTGDEDLDGHLFDAVDARFVSVSPIKVALDGTDTVTLRLSGLAGVDDELMTEIGNKANFQGRDCRIWQAMLDPDNFARIGAIWTLMTGYMNVPKILGDQQSQIIELEVESYLGFMKRASGRTYLEQQNFDPGDRSGELAIAIANGAGNRS
ncbi:hypothetical protein [Altererythrobacter sp. B11]|uniref:hypothetical protein n=1 Tax=Altererythrobacter sp. B11 TaxID=2060312 RepID=UPI001E363AD3|nr:hypothetical protein [Altererythrobacter sp. B11]